MKSIKNMRSLILGIIIGSFVTAAVFIVFGDRIRSDVSTGAQRVGQSVQRVGKEIRRAGKDIRPSDAQQNK